MNLSSLVPLPIPDWIGAGGWGEASCSLDFVKVSAMDAGCLVVRVLRKLHYSISFVCLFPFLICSRGQTAFANRIPRLGPSLCFGLLDWLGGAYEHLALFAMGLKPTWQELRDRSPALAKKDCESIHGTDYDSFCCRQNNRIVEARSCG